MDIKQVAIQAAKKAGKAVFELSKGEIKYKMKKRLDILAEADLKSEKIIIKKIKESFPDHSIYSEEAGKENRNSQYRWLIDPVDGTINFSRKIREYAVSIAVEKDGELILGVIYEPYNGNLYVAEKNKGAKLNNKPIKVSKEKNIENMLVSTDNSSTSSNRTKNFKILARVCSKFRHTRIFGSGTLHLAKVATGHIDTYFKAKGDPVSYPAGILLIEEAGGVVTDFQGNRLSKGVNRIDSHGIVASNGKIHDDILKLLNS